MNRFATVFFGFAFLILSAFPAAAVTISWSAIGNPGNAVDGTTGYGRVDYPYRLSTYAVTNSQYVEFLNVKDPGGTNALGLYNVQMNSDSTNGGISLSSGSANGSKYRSKTGRENWPVNYVSWFDSIRFANWLHNGQGNGSTETGAYTLLGGTSIPSNGSSITRNAAATVFLPNENEWYKAAYYNPTSGSYFQYPTSSNSTPTPTIPLGAPANAANFNNVVGHPSDVGAYTFSASPYGTFDQGGNVWQWEESLESGLFRVLRGGGYRYTTHDLHSSYRIYHSPSSENSDFGFRLASVSVPEPSSIVMGGWGVLAMAAAILKRRRELARHAAGNAQSKRRLTDSLR